MSDERVVPEPDEISEPYWRAAADHVLTVARCAACEGATMPPDLVCPHCLSTEPAFTFQPISGAGSICSWTVLRQSSLPGFDVPFVLVDVELDEASGVRLIGRLLDGPDADLALGARVEVAFEDLADDISIPAFTLVSPS